MDYVQVNKELPHEDRFNISGVRVTDGEDQGKLTAISITIY